MSRAGKIKALAVATAKRSAVLPDLPTLAESGLPDIQGDAWMGFIAPAKTPTAILARLQGEIGAIVKIRGHEARNSRLLMEPWAARPPKFVRRCRPTWRAGSRSSRRTTSSWT